ncbi:MAG: acetylglutamate kinase [Chloroflexota bacterium]|nr:acetylglutamate kinase [Chloroflexota bacterium]
MVVKIGGTADMAAGRIGADVRALVNAGVRVVIAHGGGDELTAWQAARNRKTTWHNGLRVTDDQTRDDAVLVFRGLVAPAVVGALQQAEVSAVGISGPDGGVVRVRQATPDLGWVGRVQMVNTRILDDLTSGGHVPVVSPLGVDGDGALYNVNGDDIAAALARATRAAALVFLTDVDGVKGADGDVLSQLDPDGAERLIQDEVIAGGMVPKVRSAIALLGDVGRVCIANGSRRHALRRALDPAGGGTQVMAEAASL